MIELHGTITKMEWINPHSWLYLNVKNADGTETLALPKAIQRDPIKDTFEHVDLLMERLAA